LVKAALVSLICGCAVAQQLQVENGASLLTGDIAAGSIAKLELTYAGGPITPIEPMTVSAHLLSVGATEPVTLQVIEVADAVSVLVLIPAGAQLGASVVTLNYNGQSAMAQVNIVAISFGLYSAAGSMALAQNVTNNGIQLNNLTHPAHPQDYVTLWGTGLGTATGDAVAVLLGGHPFPVSYAGPSGDCPGLDQINFQVPGDPAIPQGCYVAANIQIGNSVSNLATLSLSRDAGPCQHPFGLTADELARLDSGGQVAVGQIGLYSTIGPPASSSLPTAPASYVRTESANAQFLNYDASGLSTISGVLFADDYLNGCSTGPEAARLIAVSGGLNVGEQIIVQGPNAQQLNLSPGAAGLAIYNGSVPMGPVVSTPDQLAAPFFSFGQWQASAPGTSNVQPFTAMALIPNPIQITNYGSLAMIDHTRDLTITWDPTTYSAADFVNLQLYNQVLNEWFNPTPALFCRVPAIAGVAIIPAGMLASFQPSSTGSLSLSVERKPGTAAMFTIGLNDGTSIPGVFQYSSAESMVVQIQ
jgi:uncharacterized protein (TIGR03437 family)